MKTWEIWKDAEKLEGKKFKLLSKLDKSFTVGDTAVVTKYFSIYGLGAEKYSRIRIADLTGFEDWEQVQEPVDFMTAFKAWHDENKDIKCEMLTHDKERVLFERVFNGTDDATFGAGLIGSGRWYIQDVI